MLLFEILFNLTSVFWVVEIPEADLLDAPRVQSLSIISSKDEEGGEVNTRMTMHPSASLADSLIHTDPILGVFRMFGDLNGMSVSSSLAIVTYDDLATTVAAERKESDLVLVPWLPPYHSNRDAGVGSGTAATTPHVAASTTNPFDMLFRSGGGGGTSYSASVVHSEFVRGVFARAAHVDVALYVDRAGHGSAVGTVSQHLFLPFFGGPDDRLALEFVVQLCANPGVSATVVRITKREGSVVNERKYEGEGEHHTLHGSITGAFPDTVYAHATTQTRMQSETADGIVWEQFAGKQRDGGSVSLLGALSRIEFAELGSPKPLHAIAHRVAEIHEGAVARRSRMLVVVGRSRRLAAENHHAELKELIEEHGGVGGETRRTIGDVGTALVVCGGKAGLVVLQAATDVNVERAGGLGLI